MKKIKILFLIFSLFLLNSCFSQKKYDDKTIYTSFYPLYFVTKKLVWENYKVENILPNWVEIHDYEPSLKQMWDLQKSKLIILNWLWLEHYEEKLEKNSKIPLVIVWENIENVIRLDEKIEKNDEHNHSNTDPHIWLSPKMMLLATQNLQKQLEKNDIETNSKIIDDLKKLDEKYLKTLKTCQQKNIITSHNAFWYLARDYWLTQIPILWISNHEEASARNITDVLKKIKTEKIKAIFWENWESKNLTDMISKETLSEVFILNPIETITDLQKKNNEDYITIMQKNLEFLAKWLNCKIF